MNTTQLTAHDVIDIWSQRISTRPASQKKGELHKQQVCVNQAVFSRMATAKRSIRKSNVKELKESSSNDASFN